MAEVIETALSLASGLFAEPATIWAALSAPGMATLRLPLEPGSLVIASEPDRGADVDHGPPEDQRHAGREYAWTMLDHHARAMGNLAEALSPGAALLPAEPSAEQVAALEEMRSLERAEFDEACFMHQLEAHEQAIAIFEQGESVSNDQVAQYVRNTRPILEAHLEIAQLRQAQPPQPMPGQ